MKKKKIFYIPRKILGIAISIAPLMIIINSIFIILSSLMLIISMKVTSLLFDSATDAITSQSYNRIIPTFIAFITVYFGIEIISASIDFLDFRIEKKIQ